MRTFPRIGAAIASIALLAEAALAAPQIASIRSGFREQFGIHATNRADGPRKLSFAVPQGMPHSEAYLDHATLKEMGGILFLGVAQPKAGVPTGCPSLKIDLKQPSGQRLTVTLGDGSRTTGHIYDWELVPLMIYVKSGLHGLYSYMGVQAAYHRAFSNNLAGLNLFLLDSSREWDDFPSAHMFLKSPSVPGYPQKLPVAANERAWDTLQPWLGNEHLLFIDRGVKFEFYSKGGKFLVSGRPYWVAVEDQNDHGNGRIIRSFKNVQLARMSNPVIYDSAYRLAIYSAFFRYMDMKCNKEWSSFYDSVRRQRKSLDEVFVNPKDMFDRIER